MHESLKLITQFKIIQQPFENGKELDKKILLKDEENIIAQFTLRDGK